jgi:hypothetical protein
MAGAAVTGAGFAAGDAGAQPPSNPHSICTGGRVSEASRHAAMPFEISAAAAGSEAVPHLRLATHAAAATVAKGTRRSKGGSAGSKSRQLAQAAATAAVAAVQSQGQPAVQRSPAVCRNHQCGATVAAALA